MLRFTIATLLVSLAFLPLAQADSPPDGWHRSLKDGLEAAKKSNKPLFVITAWKRTL